MTSQQIFSDVIENMALSTDEEEDYVEIINKWWYN